MNSEVTMKVTIGRAPANVDAIVREWNKRMKQDSQPFTAMAKSVRRLGTDVTMIQMNHKSGKPLALALGSTDDKTVNAALQALYTAANSDASVEVRFNPGIKGENAPMAIPEAPRNMIAVDGVTST